ncbi:MAG: asparagine synthase (glutamine-hydrolyzing) [Verrucomicrobiae bacterium]|nr:asparagine synthase (glutamine-hydrolyzing) [Verrucomicrobiae bacterium]MDW8308439.1 asparagine synthase (glutamine-hydrolyzing) [Verrucomicrobiales bacterium]
MCGICGKLVFEREARVEPALIEGMMEALAHRGPDGRGKYLDGPVGLGHTRLAIIDLSTGDQPMCNEDRSVWLVYNGEVYNFPELRAELMARGHVFRSTTDTEVIVHLYEEFGEQCLERLRGMFAFALWDAKRQQLLLARDRVGIKPLYYVNTGRALLFASEIKALLADPAVRCEVNPQSVDLFLTHLCLPGGDTLWKGIQKLPPGHYLLVRGGQLTVRQYWDLPFHGRNGSPRFEEASEQLHALIRRTVRDHMISDVPVGFLLSGGVDSTVVLSCAAQETGQRISTFTVGFEQEDFADERIYARLAARQFGTDHHEITITPDDFWDFLPTLARHMEEPVYDPPAVSLHYVSKLARGYVKVLLSGEGGDEAFGGYLTYRNFMFLERFKAAVGPLAGAVSRVVAGAGRFGRLEKIGQFAPHLRRPLQEYYYSRAASPFDFFAENRAALYTAGFGEQVDAERSVQVVRALFNRVRGESPLNQMQYIDLKTSLPDDLLVKADKMTMCNSLELRVPLLDHQVLEFALNLPEAHRVRGVVTKRILKETFRRHIPREIIERKKAGFPIPVERWVRHELRDRVREVLLSRESLERGMFRRSTMEDMLERNARGENLSRELFALVTLELLIRAFERR